MSTASCLSGTGGERGGGERGDWRGLGEMEVVFFFFFNVFFSALCEAIKQSRRHFDRLGVNCSHWNLNLVECKRIPSGARVA